VEAEEYERMAAVEATHWWYTATRALLRQLVGPSLVPGGRFLDAGGGTGATGAWMAEYGTLVASDALPDALSVYTRGHPLVAGAAAADVQALPFPDRTFDAVLCITVLYHRFIADPAVAVAELARVTRPGGLVVLMEPGVRRLRRAHDRVTHAARRFSVNDLRAAAVAAGLQVSRATGAFSFLVPPAAAKTRLERVGSTSDLERHGSGLGGLLGGAAALERRVLRRISIPAGLSVVVVARRP
jgi:SAM-dependent methyltransferase